MVDARDGLSLVQRAALQPPHGDPSDVVVVCGGGHEELCRGRRIDVRSRDAIDDRVEQRLERGANMTVVGACGPQDRVCVQGGELGLLLGRAEIEEEVERLVQNMVRARLGPVDLVDHEDRAVAAAQRLAEDEFGLRHRPVHRLAMMVMPRSRSRALLSMTRSSTCWLSRKIRLWRSIPSTSVVLPWSTWAMIATLRMSLRFT